MEQDSTITIRIAQRLKNLIREVAQENELTVSKTLIHLLVKGISAYREDGILIDSRNRQVVNSLENPLDQNKKSEIN